MKIFSTFILLITVILSGCTMQPVSPSPTRDSATQEVAEQPLVDPSATPEPSPTPQPGKVFLVAPAGSNPASIQAALAELAGEEELALETLPDLQPDALTQNVRVAVMLSAPGNLADLLAAAPQAQFVVISGTDLPAAGNLTVIRWRPENQAFLGGYIAVLLSTDWRAGALIPTDGPLGAGLQDALENGGSYFCGVCAPGWPLYMTYPQVTALPADSDGLAWQSAATGLFDNGKVETFYLAAEAYHTEVFEYMLGRVQFDKTVLLVGAQTPPDALRPQWAATVGFDTADALRQAWPSLLAGKGGGVVEAPLALSDVNPDNLGKGRQRLVQGLMEELQAGTVYPFSVPAQ